MRTQLLRVFLLVFCLAFPCVLVAQTAAPSATPASASTTHAPDPEIGTPAYMEGLLYSANLRSTIPRKN